MGSEVNVKKLTHTRTASIIVWIVAFWTRTWEWTNGVMTLSNFVFTATGLFTFVDILRKNNSMSYDLFLYFPDEVCNFTRLIMLDWREAAWPSGLGRWIWNLEVPGSNPTPYCYLDLFSVVPSSTPRPRCVNSQLVSLPPGVILNSLCSIWSFQLLICSQLALQC